MAEKLLLMLLILLSDAINVGVMLLTLSSCSKLTPVVGLGFPLSQVKLLVI
jgi:hypothetical protein